jgi:hypothetical protein
MSLIICHASHELLDAMPVFEAWEMKSGVLFLQHVVIVHLQAHLLDPTLHIFVLFRRCKWIVGITLYIRLKAALSVALPCLSNVINQRSVSVGVYFHPRHWWRWLRLRVCDVFNVFELGKCVQVFD